MYLDISLSQWYWGILLTAFLLSGPVTAACWVWWMRHSKHNRMKDEAFQEVQLKHTQEAAERAFNVTVKMDEVKQHVKEVLSLPPPPKDPAYHFDPPPPGLAWYVAPVMTGLAVAMSSAGVYYERERTRSHSMPNEQAQKVSAPRSMAALSGYAAMGERQYDRALQLFQQGLHDGEDKVLCVGGIAECYLNRGDHVRADEWITQLRSTRGGTQRATVLRGLLQHAQGNVEVARETWAGAARNGDVDAAELVSHTAPVTGN